MLWDTFHAFIWSSLCEHVTYLSITGTNTVCYDEKRVETEIISFCLLIFSPDKHLFHAFIERQHTVVAVYYQRSTMHSWSVIQGTRMGRWSDNGKLCRHSHSVISLVTDVWLRSYFVIRSCNSLFVISTFPHSHSVLCHLIISFPRLPSGNPKSLR